MNLGNLAGARTQINGLKVRLPTLSIQGHWRPGSDLNRRIDGLQPPALPLRHRVLVLLLGLEPRPDGLRVRYAATRTPGVLEPVRGIEPRSNCLQGRLAPWLYWLGYGLRYRAPVYRFRACCSTIELARIWSSHEDLHPALSLIRQS